MSAQLYGVDAFTTEPFTGNPAAVCLLDSAAGPEWMQQVAAELNQPATAFLRSDNGHRQLRWFTPRQELPLCGHATLATAHVLYETGRARVDETITFDTPGGPVATHNRDGRIWMQLPAVAVVEAPVPDDVLAALGLDHAEWCGRTTDGDECVIQVASPREVEKVTPHFAALRELPVTRTIVTAPGGTGVDFTSRVFVPAIGLDEDQATGSAHAVLGPLWADRLGRDELTAVQASARRGEIAMVVTGDRVRIGGHALIATTGQLLHR